MTKAPVSYPGVYVEETRTSVKVIPGVATTPGSQVTPSALLAAGYKIVHTEIEHGGLSILFGNGNEHVLVRMTEYREGGSTEGHLIVTFTAKLP